MITYPSHLAFQRCSLRCSQASHITHMLRLLAARRLAEKPIGLGMGIIWGLIFLMAFPIAASAAVPAWQIVPSESHITFTATQNGAPTTGEFKSFSGTINFDPTQLASSNVKIVVDMTSVSASYGDVATTLMTPDWFDVKLFPQAIFTANKFTKTGDNTYQADGTLTIRDKTLPTVLTFTMQQYSATKALAKGTALLKRTQFGVGRGDWAKTDTVKDDVKVDFTLSANKKA